MWCCKTKLVVVVVIVAAAVDVQHNEENYTTRIFTIITLDQELQV
jgi:hypothetical protein